ncbi:methionyl-tRNA formyltransferase [Flavihumibacter sp. R14]|nr:methionyl-tRNA formyltransferase [Flavihumibacter soli]
MRIIFMGTPEFAVASLDALVKAGSNIVGVITAPDKPAGRGQSIRESAVKQYAREKGLNILQPHKLKDEQFLDQLRSLKADLQVVVAFRMLPEIVWNMPPKGTINLHGSLLPQYRGAAPINWAIINGETQTGVTTFFLKHEIDTGDILFSEPVNIAPDETAGNIHDKLMEVGAELLVKTVHSIETGEYQETPQNAIEGSVLKHAPKLFKDDCQIRWDMPAKKIYDLIRGLSPYPTAFSHINNKTFKIFKAEIKEAASAIKPGKYESDGKTFLRFGCIDGTISVTDVQLEGKKRMKIDEFLRGVRL